VFLPLSVCKGTLKILKISSVDATFHFSITPSIGDINCVSVTTTNGSGSLDIPNVDPGIYNITELYHMNISMQSLDPSISGQNGWLKSSNISVNVSNDTVIATFHDINREPVNSAVHEEYIIEEREEIDMSVKFSDPPVIIDQGKSKDSEMGTLIIEKQSIGNNGTFDFIIEPPAGGISFTSITTSVTGAIESLIINNVVPGDYTITELGQTGWTGDGSRYTIVPAGATSTVSFINTLQIGTLVINKTSIGGTGSFTFTITNPFGKRASVTAETSGTSGTGTVKIIVPYVTVGGYTVTEEDQIGWTTDTGGMVSVDPGQTGSISFTNTKLGTMIIYMESSRTTDFFDFDITFPSGEKETVRFPGSPDTDDSETHSTDTDTDAGISTYEFILTDMPHGSYTVRDKYYDDCGLLVDPVSGSLKPGGTLRIKIPDTDPPGYLSTI
jgi:hypothetical protein